MKLKNLSLVIAAILTTNSSAFAIQSAVTELRKSGAKISNDDLMALVESADSETAKELKISLNQIQTLTETLRKIQNTNDSDPVLNLANKAQVVLVGASAIALNSHLKASEKSRYKLQLAAATAILNTFIRHYSEIRNLKPNEIGLFLNTFIHESQINKSLSPEMVEMANQLNKISNDLLAQKSQIDTIVNSLGGTSDIATAAIVLLAVAHWISPKMATEGETILKRVSQQLATNGAAMAQNGRILGASGATAGLPDLIGITLGLDSKRSQEMIAMTLNNLDIATRKLQAQIKSEK